MSNAIDLAETEISSALLALSQAQNELNEFHNHLFEERNKEFNEQNGCKVCNGHGVILTWWTLDGAGWDEHGSCTNPECNAKVTGPNKTIPYPSSSRYAINKDTLATTDFERKALVNLKNNIEQAQTNLDQVKEKWTPSKGKEIEVTRGAKGSDKGDRGIVFWTGEKVFRFGGHQNVTLSVGYKTADGITGWTSAKCCRVINPNVMETPSKTIQAQLVRSTAKAYLININKKDMWVPKSACKILDDKTFSIADWFCTQNNI